MKTDLKSGYTTGSCAAAATKAALLALFGKRSKKIALQSLNGKELAIPVQSLKLDRKGARSSVIKFSGDDPDVTNGIQICARVCFVNYFSKKDLDKGYLISKGNLLVTGGRGIGTVTRKGIQAPLGKYAINPGPLKMILSAVQSALEENPKLTASDTKILIRIFVPEGITRGKKTLNSKLGIIGGISILGTTGIVKPMSEDALKNSLYLELKVIRENWEREWVVFVFGNYGERFCNSIGISSSQIVIISNFIGFMLESAVDLGFKKIILVGHIAKAVKIAGGIFNTHSRVADARLEIMGANALLIGESIDNIRKILASNTVDEACSYVEKQELFNLIARKVSQKSIEYVKGEIECHSLIFSYDGEILGKSSDFYREVGEIVG